MLSVFTDTDPSCFAETILGDSDFDNACRHLSIAHDHSPPYHPELNGLVESAIDQMYQTTRSALHTAKLADTKLVSAFSSHSAIVPRFRPTT